MAIFTKIRPSQREMMRKYPAIPGPMNFQDAETTKSTKFHEREDIRRPPAVPFVLIREFRGSLNHSRPFASIRG